MRSLDFNGSNRLHFCISFDIARSQRLEMTIILLNDVKMLDINPQLKLGVNEKIKDLVNHFSGFQRKLCV